MADALAASPLSARQVAKVLDVDESYISHLKNRRKQPRLPMAKKIAKLLDVDPFCLLMAR